MQLKGVSSVHWKTSIEPMFILRANQNPNICSPNLLSNKGQLTQLSLCQLRGQTIQILPKKPNISTSKRNQRRAHL